MPQRTARTIIRNKTSYLRLVRTAAQLCHGEWTPGGWEPPAVIEPGGTGGMQSESAGILTGTEGYAKYDVIWGARRYGMIYVYWDNPWYGVTHPNFATHASDVRAECGESDQPDGSSTFSVDRSLIFHLAPTLYSHSDGGGDITSANDLAHAFAASLVAFPIGSVASLFGLTGIVKDPAWEYELRDGLPSSIQSGLTGTGGGHQAIGYNFVLPHDVPGTASAQNAWRYCGQCHGMFYDGYPDKGRCPAGGGHQAIGYNFVLPHDVPGTGSAQNAWRYCGRCHGMFYDGYPEKGVCPAG